MKNWVINECIQMVIKTEDLSYKKTFEVYKRVNLIFRC